MKATETFIQTILTARHRFFVKLVVVVWHLLVCHICCIRVAILAQGSSAQAKEESASAYIHELRSVAV